MVTELTEPLPGHQSKCVLGGSRLPAGFVEVIREELDHRRLLRGLGRGLPKGKKKVLLLQRGEEQSAPDRVSLFGRLEVVSAQDFKGSFLSKTRPLRKLVVQKVTRSLPTRVSKFFIQ